MKSIDSLTDLQFCTNLAAVVPKLIKTKPHSVESLQALGSFLQHELPGSTVSYLLMPEPGTASQLAYVLTDGSLNSSSLDVLEQKFSEAMKMNLSLFFRFVKGKKDETQGEKFQEALLFPVANTQDETKVAALIIVARVDGSLTREEQQLIETTVSYFCLITKQVQEVIDHEHTVVENLVTSMADAVVVFNTQKEITLINDRSTELFQPVASQRLNLVKLLNLLYQMQLQVERATPIDLAKMVIEVVSNSGLQKREKVSLPQGIFEVTVMSITDHAGAVVGGALLFHDITDSEHLSQAKSEFIRVASHRLRTPLSSQRWNFELLLGGDVAHLDSQVQQMLLEMQHVNLKMIDLAEDLLQVSNFESGVPIDTGSQKEVDPSQLVDETIERYTAEAELRSVVIQRTHREEHPAKVLVDPQRFQQACGHILLNAIYYNQPEGSITVTTTSHEGYYKVSIKDTGIGISEGDKAKLFTKFFRGDEAVRRYTDGTGVGLFLTKLYVESWGGKLTLESTLGEGTTVQFTVPFPH